MKTILIVDDDDNIRLLMRDEFCDLNFNVITALNGEEALISFSEENIDLVILDLRMPKLDGMGVLKKIRETSSVPIIVYTANPHDLNLVDTEDYNDIHMLVKSSDIGKLTELVQSTLDVR